MLGTFLKVITTGAKLFGIGKSVYEDVTGKKPQAETPEALFSEVSRLPEDQRQAIIEKTIDASLETQKLDTERFKAMTEGDADKIKATARPQMALKAMENLTWVIKLFSWLIIMTVVQWIAGAILAFTDSSVTMPNVWKYFGEMEAAAGFLIAPLIGVIVASIKIVTKYMGCRERDKAQEYEMINGAPLQSSSATLESAANGISSIIKSFRRK